MSIQVQGMGDLLADLTKASVMAKLAAVEVVERVAEKVEQTAKSLAPRGPSGELASSIHTTMVGSAAEIGPSVRYGGFVEYGTYKDQPQPYMGPAADRHGGELVEEITRLGGTLLW